jgi:hypothetical protein
MAESITLSPPEHDRIGVIHCGVTREGFVSVAGETHDIGDGDAMKINRVRITVARKGDEYTFAKES